MKKTKLLLTIVSATTLILASCETTSQNNQSTSKQDLQIQNEDEITDVDLDNVSDTPDEYQDEKTSQSKKTKTKNAPLISFGNSERIEFLDELPVFTKTAFQNLKEQTASIVVDKKTKLSGFGTKYMASYYIITMDEYNRTLFEKAVKQYLNDFSNKKLNRKDNKSFKTYGKINGRIDWGTIKASTPNYGECTINLGYQFHGKSPYFTITIFPTYNEHHDLDTRAVVNSIEVEIFLTKSQASTLVGLFGQKLVDEVLNKNKIEGYEDLQNIDEY